VRTAVVFLTLLAAALPATAQDWKLVWCGTLLQSPDRDPLREATLVIHRDRVQSVRPGFVEPSALQEAGEAKVEVIDQRARFVLPGLIDAHVHLAAEPSGDARRRRVQESEADAALRAAHHARRTLAAGFTTVRDLGSPGDAVLALRDAIRAGTADGPRILAAGQPLSPSGGHSDPSLGLREDLGPPPGAEQGVCDGVDACRRAVRLAVKRGADWIKLTATGGVLSAAASGLEQEFLDEEIAAIVETAHQLGRRVSAHAHGARGVEAAVRAGVDSIEHGSFVDDATLREIAARRGFLVPTLAAARAVEERTRAAAPLPPDVAEKALRVAPAAFDAARRAHAAGVRIALGTDAGIAPHAENARGIAYLVEVGLSPAQALAAATTTAADLLGISADLGALEPGKLADAIAVDGNPLVDVGALRSMAFVMQGGVVYGRERP
jgi:imidazolonepropionase-like amidohydrolase